MDYVRRKIWIVVGCVLVAICFIAVFPRLRDAEGGKSVSAEGGDATTGSTLQHKGEIRQSRPGRWRDAPPPKKKIRASKLLSLWDENKRNLEGAELLEAQRVLANEANNRLSGREAAMFVDGLIERGAIRGFEGFISSLIGNTFEGMDPDEVAEWFSSISSKYVLDMCAASVGQDYVLYGGEDIQGFLDRISNGKIKSKVLGGYCISLSTQGMDPVEAARTFMRLRPEGVDYSGFVELMSSVTSRFDEVAAMIPADNQSIAKEARKRLLSRWAYGKNPREAVDYVVSHPDIVDPDQLYDLMRIWTGLDGDRAVEWATSLPEGIYRRTALQGAAKAWMRSDPERAWKMALEIQDAKARESAAREVFAEWAKIDPEAARQARIAFEEKYGADSAESHSEDE